MILTIAISFKTEEKKTKQQQVHTCVEPIGTWPRRLSRAADGKKEWDAGGLDAAREDDRAHGKENPGQDLCSRSSVSAPISGNLPERVLGLLENNSAVQHRKNSNEKHEAVSLSFPHSVPNAAPCGRQRRAKVEKLGET